jgi:predicted Ser/Thr protein kinase
VSIGRVSNVGESPVAARVGGYRLERVIGEGGMGVVHLARLEDDPAAPPVALKVLRPHVVGDREGRERLAREVASLERVRSERVAEVLDADPFGPVPFVATRFVDGPNLHQLVRDRGPLPSDELAPLALALAEALLAVHRVGVLHRDVKPTNVLLGDRGPVLIDFGLARVAEDPRITATGLLLGTPGYLAPEILYGDEATAAADVHAWAATVAFAATGRSPYGGGPAMAVLDRVRRGEHDLTGVPAALGDLLAACLASQPWERPALVEVHETLARDRDASRTAVGPWSWTEDDDAEPTRALNAPASAAPAGPVPEPRDLSGRRRVAQLGLGVLGAAVAARAPYGGALLLVLVAGLLRTASVTRERHVRRQLVRGRARWYDVPASTLALPGYLARGLVGSGLLVVVAVLVAIVAGVLVALAHPPLWLGLFAVGCVFVLTLSWGPGSRRARVAARPVLRPLGGDSAVAWVVLGCSLAAAAVLLTSLAASGPDWSPATVAPWAHGLGHRLVHGLVR